MGPFATSAPVLAYEFTGDPASWSANDPGNSTISEGGIALNPSGESIRFQWDDGIGSGASFYFDRTGLDIDLSGTGSNSDLIHIRLGFESGSLGQDLGGETGFNILFSSNNFNDYVIGPGRAFRDWASYRNQWHILTLRKSDFTPTGSIDWSAVNRLRVYVSNNYAGPMDITVDSIWVGGAARPPVTMSFDDNEETVLSYVAPALELAGFRTTIFANKDTAEAGAGAFMSTAELKTLHAAGHMVCSHLTTNSETVNATADGIIEAEILEQKEWIAANFPGSVPCVAYPSGQYKQHTVDFLRANGYVAGRAANIVPHYVAGQWNGLGHSACFEPADLPNEFESRIINMQNAGTFSDTALKVLGYVDESKDLGQGVDLVGHVVKDGVTNNVTVSEQYFDDVVAGLVTRHNNLEIEFMPYHEKITRMFGPFGTGPSTASSMLNPADGGLAVPPDYRYA